MRYMIKYRYHEFMHAATWFGSGAAALVRHQAGRAIREATLKGLETSERLRAQDEDSCRTHRTGRDAGGIRFIWDFR
jgi:hypothetical protein